MSVSDLVGVVALPFGQVGDAADLATWCSGEVVLRLDAQPGEPPWVVLVPTAKGPVPAHVGDWIVRRAEGVYRAYDPETFALLHEPAD